jgi:hypothetical protein
MCYRSWDRSDVSPDDDFFYWNYRQKYVAYHIHHNAGCQSFFPLHRLSIQAFAVNMSFPSTVYVQRSVICVHLNFYLKHYDCRHWIQNYKVRLFLFFILLERMGAIFRSLFSSSPTSVHTASEDNPPHACVLNFCQMVLTREDALLQNNNALFDMWLTVRQMQIKENPKKVNLSFIVKGMETLELISYHMFRCKFTFLPLPICQI